VYLDKFWSTFCPGALWLSGDVPAVVHFPYQAAVRLRDVINLTLQYSNPSVKCLDNSVHQDMAAFFRCLRNVIRQSVCQCSCLPWGTSALNRAAGQPKCDTQRGGHVENSFDMWRSISRSRCAAPGGSTCLVYDCDCFVKQLSVQVVFAGMVSKNTWRQGQELNGLTRHSHKAWDNA
jgi:hypothetical protein